ncbi:MAG TPA: glycosyltransferase family 9 protein [Candidatus Acidoferrum sp.]|jgi:ADP-heptose:LPS heptosyltransferase
MTRTLVIQLGRLGDVVQTTPLLGDLAASGDQVDVLVLHSTHTALLGFSAIADIITISDSLKTLDDAIACEFPHGKILVEAHELLADLQLPLYDRVINASHAPLGCWLAGAISCTNPNARYGGVIRACECLYFGPASAYRVALLLFREQNLFNLVDLIRAAPGTVSPSAPPRSYANKSVELPFALPPGRRVALNPGASELARCWPIENFARIAESLAVAGFSPLLVGAPSDRELCEKIRSSARVAIPNFAGRTSIPEMAAVLASCELLICGDTGAAHLAAAVGTTVLGLYGAAAWFAETAPYGNNHLVLQTPLNAPMSAISIDSAVAAALHRLGHLSVADLRRELRAQNQSAWETSLQPATSHDPLGGLTYHPIHRESATPDEPFAQALRNASAAEFLTPASPSHRTQVPSADPQCPHASLAEILDHMQTLADGCAESTLTGAVSSETEASASALIAAMERLRELSAEPTWKRFRPVIHHHDWQLRMLPQQSPDATFRSYGQAYASAARILKNADADHRSTSVETDLVESNEYWKGVTTKGKKRGGTGASFGEDTGTCPSARVGLAMNDSCE